MQHGSTWELLDWKNIEIERLNQLSQHLITMVTFQTWCVQNVGSSPQWRHIYTRIVRVLALKMWLSCALRWCWWPRPRTTKSSGSPSSSKVWNLGDDLSKWDCPFCCVRHWSLHQHPSRNLDPTVQLCTTAFRVGVIPIWWSQKSMKLSPNLPEICVCVN